MLDFKDLKAVIPITTTHGEEAIIFILKNNYCLQSINNGLLESSCLMTRTFAIKIATAILDYYQPSREELDSLESRESVQ